MNCRFFKRLCVVISCCFLSVGISVNAENLLDLAKEKQAKVWYDPYRGVITLVNSQVSLSIDLETGTVATDSQVINLSNPQNLSSQGSLTPKDYKLLQTLLAVGKITDLEKKNQQDPVDGLEPKPRGLVLNTLVIDPGHGGIDPGCMASHLIDGKKVNFVEKELTLKVALELEKLLKAKYPQKKIVMTRRDDSFPSLEDRVLIAHKNRGSEQEGILFLSIHFNASVNKNAKGLEFWYVPQDYQRDVLFTQDIPESVHPIINQWLDSEYKKESKELAESLSKGVATEMGDDTIKRGLKENPWYVVRRTKMPAVLAELGFITNPEEAAFLNSPDYLKRLALGLYNGMVDFVSQFEGSS